MWYSELVRETSLLNIGNSGTRYRRQIFFFLHFSTKTTVIHRFD